MDRSGGCMCGAVRFEARDVPVVLGACHCELCRRWTGSALLGVSIPEERVTWTGEEHIKRYASTSFAERANCAVCGSPLFMRNTIEGTAWSGEYDIPLGMFDHPDGFDLTHEIWIEEKPDCFSYAGRADRRRLTRADVIQEAPFVAEGDPS